MTERATKAHEELFSMDAESTETASTASSSLFDDGGSEQAISQLQGNPDEASHARRAELRRSIATLKAQNERMREEMDRDESNVLLNESITEHAIKIFDLKKQINQMGHRLRKKRRAERLACLQHRSVQLKSRIMLQRQEESKVCLNNQIHKLKKKLESEQNTTQIIAMDKTELVHQNGRLKERAHVLSKEIKVFINAIQKIATDNKALIYQNDHQGEIITQVTERNIALKMEKDNLLQETFDLTTDIDTLNEFYISFIRDHCNTNFVNNFEDVGECTEVLPDMCTAAAAASIALHSPSWDNSLLKRCMTYQSTIDHLSQRSKSAGDMGDRIEI